MDPAVISIISVSITAVACVLAPVISALISQRGAIKLKSFELFFHEKATAYKEFLHACEHYLQSPRSLREGKALLDASSNALLFSSLDTQTAIANYGQLVLNSDYPDCSSEESLKLSKAHTAVILAMQSELKEQNQKHNNIHQSQSAKQLPDRADLSAVSHDSNQR